MTSKKNEDIKALVLNDPLFVNSPKHNNNIYDVIKAYPNGTPESITCRLLCLTPEEFAKLQNSVIMKLRQSLGEDLDEQD